MRIRGGGAAVAVAIALIGCGQNSRTSAQAPTSFQDFAATDAVATKPTAECGETCQKRRQEFRYVVYVGDQIYCYWDMKKAETGTDFTKLANELEASITDQTSFTQYFKTLTRWAGAFHDGHVNAFPAKLNDLEIYSATVRTELLAPGTDHEQLVVIATAAEGVAKGDIVLAVNGVPVAQALDAAEVYKSGSTRRMRRWAAGRTLLDAFGLDEGVKPLSLTVQNAKGVTTTISLARNVQIASDLEDEKSEEDLTKTVLDGVRVLPGGVGYVKLKGFSGAKRAEKMFDQIMNRLAGTRGLVLDLRANGGGDLSGNRFLARLASKPVVRYRQSERWSDFLIAQRPDVFLLQHLPGAPFVEWHDIKVEPDQKHYDRPVAALIGAYCFSACDTFSAGLKSNKLATFVGEATGGGTGTPLVFELPVSDLMFRYSVVRGQTAEGALIEGVGTSPDVAVEPTAADRATGQDGQLKKALEVFAGASPAAIGEVAPSASLEEAPSRSELKSLINVSRADEL